MSKVIERSLDLDEVKEDKAEYEEPKEHYKYWRDDKFDLFKIEKYKPFPDHETEKEFVELVYLIKRGNLLQAKDVSKEKDIKADTILRPNGDTILHVCAEYGQEKLFHYFYQKLNANLDVVNYAKETPLILAAREGRLLFIQFMYDKYSLSIFNPDHRTLDGWTALTYASINGFTNTVEFLAETIKVNLHTSDRFKRTAVHWAARYNNVSMFQLLLRLGLNHQALDIEAMSPMELAKAFNADGIIKVLHER